MKMKYTADDFDGSKKSRESKTLAIVVDAGDYAALKGNANRIGVSASTLARRCLKDAGLFNYEISQALKEAFEGEGVDSGSSETD